MSDPAPLAEAAFHFVPALLWAIIAWAHWQAVRAERPANPLFPIVAGVASLQALHYLLHTLIALTPTELDGRAPGLHTAAHALLALSLVGSMALFRHQVPLLAIREERPSRTWLTVHYGSALLVGAVAVSPLVVPASARAHPWFQPLEAIVVYYFLAMMVLCGLHVRRLMRRGVWLRYYSVAFGATFALVLGILGLAAALGLGSVVLSQMVSIGGTAQHPRNISLIWHTAFGLAFAAPFAAPMLAETVRPFLVGVAAVAAVALVSLGLPGLTAGIDSPEMRQLVEIAAVGLLVLTLLPGRTWLQGAIDRVLFRQSQRWRPELQALLQSLKPERGALECCRCALERLVQLMPVRGAAIILARERGAIASGNLPLEPIARVWSSVPDTLPATVFSFYVLPNGPVRDALAAGAISRVVPITSPRERWGHLLIAAGFLSAAAREDHVETLQGFADQLALVLDAADLLGRTLAVERALAHAEKLSAIGETAARIAHEIRNPVTAARSLAQQLAREPGAPFATELSVILGELERVERQVAALLRFARREDLRLEPIDVGTLARTTAEEFRARLEALRVNLDLDVAEGLVVRADREKLRQVLINLIENAMDALSAAAPDGRRMTVEAAGVNGAATLLVTDTGPGVPADALPRLFEPFFSLKEHGTGLGLAIVRRTIEAHGGRIEAAAAVGGGLTFRIDLPLGGA